MIDECSVLPPRLGAAAVAPRLDGTRHRASPQRGRIAARSTRHRRLCCNTTALPLPCHGPFSPHVPACHVAWCVRRQGDEQRCQYPERAVHCLNMLLFVRLPPDELLFIFARSRPCVCTENPNPTPHPSSGALARPLADADLSYVYAAIVLFLSSSGKTVRPCACAMRCLWRYWSGSSPLMYVVCIDGHESQSASGSAERARAKSFSTSVRFGLL